jgi:hypothetical protein
VNLNDCLKEKLNRYEDSVINMNTVISPDNVFDDGHMYIPFSGILVNH